MFESKGEIAKAVELVLGLFATLNRGDTLEWEKAEAVLGETRDSNRFRYVVWKARKRLLREFGIVAWPVEIGVGLQLLTNTDTIRICAEKRQRKMARQAHRAIKELSSVDPMAIGLHDRRLQAAQLTMLRMQRRDARKQARTVTKTEVNPRRRVG